MSDEQPHPDVAEPGPQAEAEPERPPLKEGEVDVRLVTEAGEADIRVPPRGKWKSIARNRLSTGDDMGWAVLTLSREDAEAWIDLDPDQEEAAEFFSRYDRLAPVANRADRRRHLRAAS